MHDIYEESYLENIKDFLLNEIKSQNINFIYGKGTRKTGLQRHFEKTDEYLTKLKEYRKHLEIMGSNRNSYSRTDHGATFMRMKEDHMLNGQLKPGYNVQIGVSDEYIVHIDFSRERNDYNTFIPFLETFHEKYSKYPKYPVADSGYGGLKNYRYLKDNGMELYTKYNMYYKDIHEKKRMKDPYFSHNLIKDGKDFIAPNGDRLTYLYI
ncbi:MAG: transposase [Candidatus Izemoplasmatales bacterium]